MNRTNKNKTTNDMKTILNDPDIEAYDWGSFSEPNNESCTGTTTCEEQPPEVCQDIFELSGECQVTGGTLTDIDGNQYEAITIGNQIWMVENLKVTHYNNGDEIPNITNDVYWNILTTGAYSDYDNNPSNSETYGRLYNWYTVDDDRGICPEGWHVPSDGEWKELEMALGMSQSEANNTGWRGTNEGSKLAGNANLWLDDNLENNAEFGTSGFNGVPSGYRSGGSNSDYHNIGTYGHSWSSTEYDSLYARNRKLGTHFTNVFRDTSGHNKQNGYSVRCLADDNTTIDDLDDLVCTGSDELDCAYYESILSYCLEGCEDDTIPPDDESCTGTTTCEEQPPEGCQDISESTGECQVTGGTLTDIDGNQYETIAIGNQIWMVENLKVTHYNNGDVIPNITNNGDWSNLTTGAYSDYDNNPSNSETYGRLYNWYTVDDSRGICPEGWHVPSDEEFKTLEMYLGMSQSEADVSGWRGTNEGSKLAGNASLWSDGNLEINPEFGTSGFNAPPSGYRYFTNGYYNHIGNYGYFWSSTENFSFGAWVRGLGYGSTDVYRGSYDNQSGFSVRCLADDNTTIINDWECTGSDELDCAYYESILSYCLEGCENDTIPPDDESCTGTATCEEQPPEVCQDIFELSGECQLSVTVSGTVADIDGNQYETIIIGNQYWMAENLKVTHYNNGDEIPNITNNGDWSNLTTGAYSYYNDDPSNLETYGNLYNWFAAVDERGICPEGWHVPSDEEWKELEMALGMSQSEANNTGLRGTNEGSKLAGNASLWSDGNLKNNAEFGTSGFNALPSGYRNYNSGDYYYIGFFDYFWSSTEFESTIPNIVRNRALNYNFASVYRGHNIKQFGLSIRCLADNITTIDDLVCIGSDELDCAYYETILSYCLEGCEDDTIPPDDESCTGTTTCEEQPPELCQDIFEINDECQLSVTDIDGNVYETITIGNQYWMLENLKVTHYNNGDVIPHITNNGDWGSYDEGQYGVYDNDPSLAELYGNLYNWVAVDDERGICPEGWHVPSDEEFKTLEMYLGMSQSEADGIDWRGTNEGSKLAGNANLWNNGNLEINPEFGTSGFNALPSGYRSSSNSSNGFYNNVGNYTYFWLSTEYSSTTALHRSLFYNTTNVKRWDYGKQNGFPVRCLADDNITINDLVCTGSDELDCAYYESILSYCLEGCEGGFSDIDPGCTSNLPYLCPQGHCAISREFCYFGGEWEQTSETDLDNWVSSDAILYCEELAYPENGIGYNTDFDTIEQIPFLNGDSWVPSIPREAVEGSFMPSTIDVDGNEYESISFQSGSLSYAMLTTNLKTTKYNNGDDITTGLNNNDWSNTVSGSYSYYNDDPSNLETHGNLYNWFAAVDERGICPEGWHVPSDEEFKTLEMYLGMSQSEADAYGGRGTNEGSKLAGNASLWVDGNLVSNAEFGTSGFNALPSGNRSSNFGYYYGIGNYDYFWLSTESYSNNALYRRLHHSITSVYRNSTYKQNGYSIRCMTDNPIQTQTIPPGQGTGQGLYTNSYGDQFQIPTDGLTHYKVSDLQLIEFFIVNCEGSSYYHQSINPFNFISDQSHWSIQYESNFNHTGETHVFKSLSVFRPEDWVDENGERVISPFGCKCISTNDIADFFHVNMNMIDPECNDFATCQYQMLTTDGHLPAGTNLSTIDLDYLGIYGTLDELVHAMQLQTHHENTPFWFDYGITNTTIADTLGVFRLSHNNITSNWFTNEGCYSTGDYGHFPMYCNTWQRIFSENIFPEVYHVRLRNNHLYGWIDRTMLDWSWYNNNPPAHLTDQFPDYRSFLAYNTNLQTVNLKHNHLGWGDNMLYEHLPSSLLCQNIISNLGLENNNFCPPYPECYDSSVFSNQDLPFHFHTNGNHESQGYTHGIRHSNCHLTETVICCVDHDFTGLCDIDSPIIEISDSPTGIGPVLPCSENHTYAANYSANASNQCILWLNNYFQSNYIGMGASPDYINGYMSCNLFAYEENYSNTHWINCPGGNCSTDILGCMDVAAENYNPEATVNYECIYTAGCTDPIAENYVAGNDGCDSGWGVIIGDNSCCEYTIGCMDVFSSNFDLEATMPCEDEDLDGYPDCCEYIEGCTDPLSSNYNSDAVIDDGSCADYAEELFGCSDPFADNYVEGTISCTETWNITPPYIDFDCCTYPQDWDGNWFACIDRAAINCDPQCIQCNQNGNVECLSCPQIAILPDGWNDIDGDGAPDTICEICEYGELGCTNRSVPHTGDVALSALNYSPIAQIFDGTCDYGNLEQNVCEPFILYLVVDMTGSMSMSGIESANELLQHYATFEEQGGFPCGFGLIATSGWTPHCETSILSLDDALYLTSSSSIVELMNRCAELDNIATPADPEDGGLRTRTSMIPHMHRAYEHLMNDEYYSPHQGCLDSESPQKIIYVATDDDGMMSSCTAIPNHQGDPPNTAGPYDIGYGVICSSELTDYYGSSPCSEVDIQIFRQQLIENNVKVFMDLWTNAWTGPCNNSAFDYRSMVFHFGPHPNFIYDAVPYSVPTDCNCTHCPGNGICWWDGYGNYDHTEKCCFYNCVNGSDGCCTQWEYAGCASDDCTGQLQDWLDNFLIDIDGDGIPDGFDYDGDGEIDDTWDDLGWIWPDWPDDFGGQGYGCDDPAAANCDCWCEECAGQTNYLISAAIGSCVPSAEDSTEGVIELCANLVFDDEGDELLYPIYGCESDSQCSWIPLVCGGNVSSCINDNSCKYFGCVDNSINVISCEDSDNNYYDLPGQECFHPDNDGCNPSDDAWITNEHYCCVYTEEIFGCTDTGACNYDPDATAFQDDSCVYAADLYGQYCDCDGVEIYYSYDLPVFGVSNINYQACDCNTLPLVCCVDVSGNDTCDHYNDLVTSCEDECPEGYKILDDLNDNIPPSQDIDIFGCMDDTAYNYNPNATEENNTCIFLGCNPDHDFCIDVEEIKPLPFEQDCCTVGDEGTCIYAAHGCWWSELLNHCYIEGEHHTPGEPIPIDHDTMCGTPSVDLADQYGYVQFTYSYPEQLDVGGMQFSVYSPFYENTELGYCTNLQNVTPLPDNSIDCFNAGGSWEHGGFEFIDWDNVSVSNTLGVYDYDTALQGNWTLAVSSSNVIIFNNTNTSDPYISTTIVNRAPLMKIKYNIHTANPDYILSYLDLCIELDNIYIGDLNGDALNASSSKCANVILQPGSGDVDLDLVVSVADIILLIAMIMDEFTLDSYTEDQLYVMNILGNINFDGEINVADILLVISIILYGPSFVLSPEDELKMQQIQKVVQRHQKIKTKEPIIPGKPFRPSKRKIINILNKFNLNAKKMSKKSLQPPRVK